MGKPKEYRLETISDIIDAVNAGNIDNFLIDLKSYITSIQNMYFLARHLDPTLKDKSNSEIGQAIFNWIDDGKHESNGGLIVESPDGEKVTMPLDVDVMNGLADALKK